MGYKTNQPTASCPASCGQDASTLTGTVVCEGSDGSIASDSKCSGTKPSAPTKSCGKTSDCTTLPPTKKVVTTKAVTVKAVTTKVVTVKAVTTKVVTVKA